ncbi:MAG: hypothetical protein JWO09_2712 [Bacteroidetes bacterium]|nr:hypothetical protein [Bacteroidota bacterium]
MIVHELNQIRDYTSAPTAKGLKRISPFITGGVGEEYFLLESSRENSEAIYLQLIKFQPDYFKNKIDNIFEGKYTNAEFQTFRFLISVAKANGKSINSIIKQVDYFISQSKRQNSNEVLNSQITWFVSEIIISFPIDKIRKKHLHFIQEFASHDSLVSHDIKDKLIPKVIEEKRSSFLLVVLNDLIFKFNRKESHFGVHTHFDKYYLNELITEENVSEFVRITHPDRLLKFSIKKLKKALLIDAYYFSSISLPSIEDTDQIMDKGTLEYSLMKFVRIQLEQNLYEDNFIINEFIKSKHVLFKRLGVHYIANHYDLKKHLFWNLDSNPLDYGYLKHEVFILLQTNSSKVTQRELNILFGWIDSIKLKKWNPKASKADVNRARAIEAKEYLIALNEVADSFKQQILAKKEELDKINNKNSDHPGFNSYFSFTTSPPLNYDMIDQDYIKVKELIDELIKDMSGVDVKKRKLRVKEILDFRPELLDRVEKLRTVNLSSLNDIIRGFQQRWEGNSEDFDWTALLNILWLVIESPDFKANKGKSNFLAYCSWLIRAGTQDDNHAISGEDLEYAKDFCLKMLSFKVESELLNKDPFFDILNNTDGKIFDATLNVLLRNARINKTEAADKWYPEIKSFYTNVLENENPTKAFLWNVAGSLPQFGYLDIDWVERMIDKIFPPEEEIWKFSMLMYHNRVHTVYKNLFDILFSKGYYDRALDSYSGTEKEIPEICHHIILACLAEWKNQEITSPGSLFNKILETQNLPFLKGVIGYFITNKNYPISKMLDVWERIIDKISRNVEEISLELIKLADRIDIYDERAFRIVDKTLSNVNKIQRPYQLYKKLTSVKTEDMEIRAKLLMKAADEPLSSFVAPLIDFTKKLYTVNKPLADDFVIALLQKRAYPLLPIYNEFN